MEGAYNFVGRGALRRILARMRTPPYRALIRDAARTDQPPVGECAALLAREVGREELIDSELRLVGKAVRRVARGLGAPLRRRRVGIRQPSSCRRGATYGPLPEPAADARDPELPHSEEQAQ